MRRAANVDSNQSEITKAFRQIGASVQLLHMVGKGCPDALVGYRGKNILVEIKDGAKPKCKQSLNKNEKEWHAKWGGQVCVVTSVQDAVEAVIRECVE